MRTTPVLSLRSLAERCGGTVAVKAENLQRTGSFKLRDRTAADCRGVVAGSAGNHAQLLAYAARAPDIPCTVFMPQAAAVSKVAAVEAFGASVRKQGTSVDGVGNRSCSRSASRRASSTQSPSRSRRRRRQAGLGLELLHLGQLGNLLDRARGGGELAGGIAAAVKLERPEVRVIGVQASGCAPFPTSLEAHLPTPVATTHTIADGIAIKRPVN
ncbi:MAG: pyridoxal-phosphate dependent enzyme [Gammaproteobacteria bacterium]